MRNLFVHWIHLFFFSFTLIYQCPYFFSTFSVSPWWCICIFLLNRCLSFRGLLQKIENNKRHSLSKNAELASSKDLSMAKSYKWLCTLLWSACLPAIVSGALSNLILLEPRLSCSCFNLTEYKWVLLQADRNVVCRIKCNEANNKHTSSKHNFFFCGCDTKILFD